ncbi:MAG: glycosyltransferase [Planctomycetes bacterium]|nr:glycosyltransferase [Planctomycetota bacterium]
MTRTVSVVIPTLADRELLDACLAALADELRAEDEVVVVDDSGAGALVEWLRERHPAVRCVATSENLGFARALLAGVEAARGALVLALNPDVRLQPGALAALVAALADDVHAVAPYVLLHGEEAVGESLPELALEDGFPVVRHRALDVVPGAPHAEFPGGVPVAFALGGCMLVRRADFLAAPFDPRYEPFYWEDVDWAQSALRAGRRVLVEPRAVAHHHHRGTIAPRIPERLVRAAIEKNRLLFAWKHLEADDRRAHLAALTARLVEHTVCEDREELVWLLLALEQELAAPAAR